MLEQKSQNDPERFTDNAPEKILQDIEIRTNRKIDDLNAGIKRKDSNIKNKSNKIAKVVYWIMWVLIMLLLIAGIALGFVKGNMTIGIISVVIAALFSAWTPFDYVGFH